MSLARIESGLCQTPNFTLRHGYQQWTVSPRTPLGSSILPKPVDGGTWTEVQLRCDFYERRLQARKDYPPYPPMPTTAAELCAFREYLFPGKTTIQGWQAMARMLDCTRDYYRHMESGRFPFNARNGRLLYREGIEYMKKIRKEAAAAARMLEPMEHFYRAMEEGLREEEAAMLKASVPMEP